MDKNNQHTKDRGACGGETWKKTIKKYIKKCKRKQIMDKNNV
jgi:hypothetical protein